MKKAARENKFFGLRRDSGEIASFCQVEGIQRRDWH